MAAENVELVREVLDSWADGDFRSALEHFDPDVSFETFMPDAGENVAMRGVAELATFTRGWLAQWSNYRIVADELRPVGGETVFASVRQIAEGGRSGVPVESPGYSVWTVRDGRVVALSLHYDRAEALAAAGLAP